MMYIKTDARSKIFTNDTVETKYVLQLEESGI